LHVQRIGRRVGYKCVGTSYFHSLIFWKTPCIHQFQGLWNIQVWLQQWTGCPWAGVLAIFCLVRYKPK
jgi:hypothetical protein